MAKGHLALRVFLLTGALLWGVPGYLLAQTKSSPDPSTQAAPAQQGPLTVQSNMVLVPVFVYDPARMAQAPAEELPCARAAVVAFFKLLPTQPYLPKDCDVTEVGGLTAKDFHVFEDGAEQEISGFEAGAWRTVVRDNLGWHLQSSDTPSGIWGLNELSRIKKVPFVSTDLHILGYVPHDPKPGCHRIKVEVDRANLLVFARNQYCAGQTPFDPLYGTDKGRELERELSSEKHGKIPLSLQAAAFYTDQGTTRVDVSLSFPSNDLYHSWDPSSWTLYARIGVMGVVRRKDGTIAARFSDLLYPSYWPTFDQGGAKYISWEKGTARLSGATGRLLSPATAGTMGSSDSYYGNDTLALTFPSASEITPNKPAIQSALNSSDPFWLPTRYETQIDLPPGDYNLEVVLNDEWAFGRAQMPLTIDSYDGKQLALSSVALCKRLRDAAVAAKEDAAANFAPQYVSLVSKGIWFTPTGDTNFENGESLFAYFEVYEPLFSQNAATSVRANMRIIDPSTGKVITDFAPLDAAPYVQSGSSVLHIARKILTSQLPKGSYRLEVQATDSAGRTTAWRGAGFAVE
jgi:hypothetical protein